jgi:hypothetical protein
MTKDANGGLADYTFEVNIKNTVSSIDFSSFYNVQVFLSITLVS